MPTHYYFDDHGWLTAAVLPARVTDIAPPDAPLPEGRGWNFTGHEWLAMDLHPAALPEPVVDADLRVTGVAFKRRLTAAERIAIRTLAATNAHVYDYMDLLDSALVVHLDDVDTMGGLQMLESAGVLATGRTAAIMSAPIQPGERPA